MAGESPDKVERVESSGETTGDGDAVASTDGKRSKAKSGSGSGPGQDADKGKSPSADGSTDDETSSEAAAQAADDTSDDAESAASGSAENAGGSASGNGGGGDDRLKAAVAAWVAGGDDESGDETSADADPADGSAGESAGEKDSAAAGEAGEAASDAAGAESEKAGAGEEKSSQFSGGALPVRPRSAGGDGSGGPEGAEKPSAGPAGQSGAGGRRKGSAASSPAGADGAGVDHPTAMFRTVEPDSGGEPEDAEAAARRAERLTSAFFGPGKSDKTTDSGSAEADSDRSDAEQTDAEQTDAEQTDAEKSGEAEASAASPEEPAAAADTDVAETPAAETDDAEASAEPAATESATEPAAAETAAEDADAEEPSDQPSEEPSGTKADAESADEPEAGAGEGAEAQEKADEKESAPRVDEATTAFRTVDLDGAGKKKNGTVDEATTAFRVDPDAVGRKKGAVDQPTAVFRTVEPGKGAAGTDAAKTPAGEDGAAEPESGKTSGGEATGTDASAKSAKPADPRVAAASGTTDSDTGGKGAAAKDAGDKADAAEAPAEAPKPAASPESGPKAETEQKAATGKKAEPKRTPKDDAAKDADAESESESERTSQFVPLKSADAPPRPTRTPDVDAPPKPEAAPGELPAEAGAAQLTEAELTRQQARPDQAPLDLLAQLTNTPPPPETPLRTAARRVKIWTPLVVLLAIVFVVAQAFRPLPEPEVSLTASPAFSFQGAKPSVPWPSEGQATLDVQGLGSFGSAGKQKPVPIASVAKVMTAYVILREHPVKKGSDGATIPVDKKAEDEAGLSAQNESTVEVKRGDKISQREAVEAIMIASANNVARLLARWDAGSEKAFAKKMNAAAKDLGMTDTRYTDPSGLNSSTVSTSDDQVKLAKKAMGIDLFRETVRLPGYKDAKGEEHGNWNKLVPVDGVVGIKTGTTTKAGGNLLFAAEQKVGGTKQLIVGAVLGQYQPSILDTVLRESKKLIDTAQSALRAQKVVRKGEVVGYVDDQLGGRTPVVATRDVSAVGWSGLKVGLALTDGGKPLPHEGSAGDRAGTLTVGDGPGQVRVPVALKEDMSEPGFGAKLTRIL